MDQTRNLDQKSGPRTGVLRFQFSVAIVKMREATVNYFPTRNNLTNQLIRSGDRK